jgi:hypothetical protein
MESKHWRLVELCLCINRFGCRYPAFRNAKAEHLSAACVVFAKPGTQNPDHMADLARHWNIEVDKVPHVRNSYYVRGPDG